MKKKRVKKVRKIMKRPEVIDENYLTSMTREEIHEVVSAANPGTMYTLTMIDGAPITLTGEVSGQLFVTETFSVRFKINYYKIKEVAFKSEVQRAYTPEQVAAARKTYESLKHKDYVAPSALAELKRKESLVASGAPIPKIVFEKKDEDEKIDPKKDFFKECKNGNTQLRAYATFKKSVVYEKGKKDFTQDKTKIRFFVRQTDGSIFELHPEKFKSGVDEKDKKVDDTFASARATARAIAKKKGSEGKKTLCPFPSLHNILKIE